MSVPEILVVDDEAPIRSILLRWAAAWGYRAREAASAAEALELMAASPADIMLCDVGMPERDGLWLAERVREAWPATAIIMGTGVDESVVIRTSRRLGAVGYVTKPFDPRMLRQAIDHAAGRLQFRASVEQINRLSRPIAIRPTIEGWTSI